MTAGANPVIYAEGLSKSFRGWLRRTDVRAVTDVNLTVSRGEVVAFVGPNGAGKTTTIHLLLGLLHADRGSVQLFGEPAGSMQARRRTGYQSEIFHTYGFKTAADVLRFYGRLSGMADSDTVKNVPRQLERLGLGAAASRKVGGFSKGMTQRLGLAQALLHEPELLVLDEPTTGLDPEGRKLVADIILEEKLRGTTIFLSSHILSDVERVCDRVVILSRGAVVFSQRMDELRDGEESWEIEIDEWTPAARAAADSFDGASISADGSFVRCAAASRQRLLRLLLESGASVGAMRGVRSLEDLYMQYAGGSSNG